MVDDPLIELGKKIKARREELKLSIEDVAISSRVSAKYVESIENADRTDLPEEVYLVGFLNLILKTLKLDKDELIEEYRDKESYHVIQTILADQKIERAEKNGKQTKKKAKKAPAGSYFKIYQLYIFAFAVILTFGVVLVNKFNKKLAANNHNKFTSQKVVNLPAPPEEEKKPFTLDLNLERNFKKQEQEEELKKQKEILAKKKKKKQKKKSEKPKEEKQKLEEEKPQLAIKEPLEDKEPSRKRKRLKLKVTDTAWFQIIAVGKDKVLFEGDVRPDQEPNSFEFEDSVGFVIATGNAGGFEYSTGKARHFQPLGQKNQLIKWYYPESARFVYKESQRQKAISSDENKKVSSN